MKAKKAMKKIAALGMGATMVGATLLGASAANLGNYPNMFMKDNQFNGLLVVGEEANSVDTIGMSNVAMGLQAASVQETPIQTGDSEETSSVSEGVSVADSGDEFNLGDDIATLKSTFDESDLPNVLADGTYDDSEGATDNEEDYTQKLEFLNNGGKLVFTQDDDDAPEAGAYLKFPKSGASYEYTLEFGSPVEFEEDSSADGGGSDDLESTTIDIQGQTYTITDASFTDNTNGNKVVDEITMLAGETMQWMTQGDVVTKNIDGVEHEIEMINVDEDAESCGLSVDGTTEWIDVDNSETVNGVQLGVTDAKAVHTKDYDADICKVNFGSEELVLSQGDEVEQESNEVEGTNVDFDITGDGQTGGEWQGFKVSYTPEDDVFLPPNKDEDSELADPTFGNYKTIFGSITEGSDMINYEMGSEDGTITFKNSQGNEIEIPVVADTDNSIGTNPENSIVFGEDTDTDDRVFMTNNANTVANTCKEADLTNCEGARWLVNDDGEAHMVELTDVDLQDNEIGFEDLTTGTTDESNDYDYNNNDGATSYDDTVYVSGLGDLRVYVDHNDGDNTANNSIKLQMDNPVDSTGGNNPIETEGEATLENIAVDNAAGAHNLTIQWKEYDDDGDYEIIENTIHYDEGSDEALEIKSPQVIAGATGGWQATEDFSADNDDDQVYVTPKGTVAVHDSEDNQEFEITHTHENMKANVFVSPTDAQLRTTGGSEEGSVVSQEVQKIGSQVTKFDTEVDNPESQDLITIGGPCANSVSSALMGNPENCAEGFESGMALLKLVENGDNTALVVAGGEGKDTRIASKVLQDFEEYSEELSGSEMKLTTVSESDIGFESVE